MNNQLIESLRRAAAYPHAVASVRVIETHVSWVFLTGDYVYKVKKPVDFGFLDFSTLAKRRHYCEEELRLNRRFAPDLYLAVVAITGTPDAPVIGGVGEVLDYAVKMREFPQRSLWQNCMDRGEVSERQIDELAARLAAFHQDATVAAEGAGTPVYGSLKAVTQAALENFEHIGPLLENRGQLRQLSHLQGWTQGQLARLDANFSKRQADGFIRECHGDLHLGNIAIIDGEITLFDCLEFNDQLRWIDTMAELGFLLMDLEDKGRTAWASRLLNIYMEFSGDYRGLQVLPFYKVYRALVRAKVAILRLAQADTTAAEKETVLSAYSHYMTLAEGYTRPPAPFLAITHGVAGTGKSTVAAAVAAATGAIRIRSDVERKRLFGLRPQQDSSAVAGIDIYSREATAKTFDRLAQLACRLLEMGQAVIVDATFLDRDRRRRFKQLAEVNRVSFAIVDCVANPDTLAARLEARARLPESVSEAGIEVMHAQQRNQTPLADEEQSATITVNTEQPLNLASIAARLAG
ncbi:AAA family ATPase [Exilibacterium tricleocarpae]|uniref:bifunctional aminoglycoside phosphotransferase/ATP-binding protein n=1 Tax=Exilibacterium tricleocarpae TaxID=2591008 RepID=UPI0015D2F4E2|nr:bifunctional aminoglycoside phosphotransferase/ATP-binding protein [Exilibacterium tricleocarpae]